MVQFTSESVNTFSNLIFPHSDPYLPQRVTIGHERTAAGYSWRGLERPDGPTGIFQYTLAGRGVLERGGTRHILQPGDAFLVEIPDDHHYYLPEGWEPWEFVFLCFDGSDALHHAHEVIAQSGSVLALSVDHPVLAAYSALFTAIHARQVADAETLAEYLYRFIISLRRVAVPTQRAIGKPIALAVQFTAQHFAEDINVDDLANAANLSRAHFSRRFMQEMELTPLAYLMGIRLERACCLLRATRLPLHDIAEQCGFSGSSYFGKVFRKTFGITALAYREGQSPIITHAPLPEVATPPTGNLCNPCVQNWR